MVLSLIITKVKVSLVCPTLSPVTAGFSTAPQVRAFTVIWSIQKDMTPSLSIFLSSLSLYQLPTPLSQLWKHKIFEPASPGSSSKYHPLLSLPLYFSEVYTYWIYVLTSYSLSHSRLASIPTPPLKLPSLGHQWLSSLISGLTLLILCCNRHLYLLSETSYFWCPRQYLLLPLWLSSPDSCPNFIIYTYQSSTVFYPQTQFLPFPILWILLR